MTGAPTAIYLDHQATTPVDPRVLDAMLPWFSETFGNAHSEQHVWGRQAADAVEVARAKVAALIGVEAREIVFTSGATESNNLAIKGALRFALHHGRGDHIVSVVTEHKCVLESCAAVTEDGARITYLEVGSDGLVDPEAIAAAIEDDTVLVSVMAVNNEIGVVQPLAAIGALCRERGVLLHTDAAQAAGKVEIDVNAMQIDLLSISGHKMYAPKGIGALYTRRRPRARLQAEISGGGQERGYRSGTLPVPLTVALGEAAEIAGDELAQEGERLTLLRTRMLDRLRAGQPDLFVNGSLDQRVPGNLNVGFPGVDAETLMESLDTIAVSTGSACTSASVEPSYVLRALGLSDADAGASIRIGFGRFTTESEVDTAADLIVAAVRSQRSDRSVRAAE
ncbi:MAG: IscS subfamily cysteine desulfurase [Alphaproteobacteria bacterium]|nr:IscS subfamily cysteine desulfurase [Alphaproteobacteria bacterium]|tara:strand:- start:931 stop:2115 length:1185 start_codon:yes stop_codon:yes gene_type:complete